MDIPKAKIITEKLKPKNLRAFLEFYEEGEKKQQNKKTELV